MERVKIESSNFVHGLAPEVLIVVMTNCPQVGVVKVTWCFYFWQISVNISKTVQDIDILTDLQWQTNRKSYMAYQTAATAVTFNDFNGHSPVAGLFKCTPSNICATRFQLTVCSHGSSALAELLVIIWRFLGNVCVQLVRKSSRVRVCVCVDRCTCR